MRFIDSAEVVAFGSSVEGLLGTASAEPAADPTSWQKGWSALVDLGMMMLLDPDEGMGGEGLAFAVAGIERLAVVLHPAPAHALVPVSAVADRIDEHLPHLDGAVAVAAAVPGFRVSQGEQPRLTGVLRPQAGLEGISHLLVHVPDEQNSLFLVSVETAEVAPSAGTFDLTRSWSEVTLADAPAGRLTETELGVDPAWLMRVSRLLVAADTAALVASAVRRTVEYARTRQTFGSPIGQYQAVQHRLVEHSIKAQQMVDLVRDASGSLGVGADDQVSRVLLAQAFCMEHAFAVISDCIQLTGGIGFTWEYGLHHALRRVQGNAAQVGGARLAHTELALALAF
jgi:hypothetical protein